MIIRYSLLRQCRGSVPRNATRAVQKRWQSTQYDLQAGSATSAQIEPSGLGELAGGQSTPATQNPKKAQRKSAEEVAEEYLEFKRQSKIFGEIGGVRAPHYKPHELVTNPPRPEDVTLELLLASQTHMGHAISRWNPSNSQYIFGVRDGTHIISLEETAAHLRRAARVVKAVAAKAGLILFVGTREGQDRAIVKASELSGGFHLFDRWVPGSLTNSRQILGRCRLKVVDEFDEEVGGHEAAIEELPPMRPDLVVCLNPLENQPLLQECAQNNVPTIGVIDTNANPLWVTYPIPANDDSLRSTSLIAGVLGRAGQQGREYRLQQAEYGKILAHTSGMLRKPDEGFRRR